MNQTGTLRLDLTFPTNAQALRFGPTDETPKQLAFPIAFDQPFERPPLVMVAVSSLLTSGTLATPSNHANDVKFSLLPRNITSRGFDVLLTIHPGDSTNIIDVSWIALTP